MNEPVTIDSEFKSLIPPLSAEEYQQLEENCKRDGIMDSLKVWHGILIDGHNRYQISEDNDLNYQTEEMDFPDRESVIRWIILNQFGRRNLSAYDRSVLALKLKPVITEKAKINSLANLNHVDVQKSAPLGKTRDELAKVAGVSHDTIHKVETIVNSGNREIEQAVKSGDISINQGYRTIIAERTPHPQTTQQKKAGELLEAKERHKDYEQKKSEGIVNIGDARQDREDKKRIAKELYEDLRSWTRKGYWIGALNNSNDFDLLADIIPEEERAGMSDRIQKMIIVLNKLWEVLSE